VLAHLVEVPVREDGSLAQVGPEVVDEHASFYVASFGPRPFETNRSHYLRG
jgi:hypothetical protein